MKVHFCLTMARDGVSAACRFEADVNWLALDMGNVDKMKGFKPLQLHDLMMFFEDGSTVRYRPPPLRPKGIIEWLRGLLGINGPE